MDGLIGRRGAGNGDEDWMEWWRWMWMRCGETRRVKKVSPLFGGLCGQ